MAHAPDQKAKDNVQAAEPGAKHQYLEGVRQQQRHQAEQYEERTQCRDDSCRCRTGGDQGTAVEKQPGTGNGMQVAAVPVHRGHDQTRTDGRDEAQRKFVKRCGGQS